MIRSLIAFSFTARSPKLWPPLGPSTYSPYPRKPPLNVNWMFRRGGGKAVDVSAGHFWTKANWCIFINFASCVEWCSWHFSRESSTNKLKCMSVFLLECSDLRAAKSQEDFMNGRRWGGGLGSDLNGQLTLSGEKVNMSMASSLTHILSCRH